jgi:hypothetical protein
VCVCVCVCVCVRVCQVLRLSKFGHFCLMLRSFHVIKMHSAFDVEFGVSVLI